MTQVGSGHLAACLWAAISFFMTTSQEVEAKTSCNVKNVPASEIPYNIVCEFTAENWTNIASFSVYQYRPHYTGRSDSLRENVWFCLKSGSQYHCTHWSSSHEVALSVDARIKLPLFNVNKTGDYTCEVLPTGLDSFVPCALSQSSLPQKWDFTTDRHAPPTQESSNVIPVVMTSVIMLECLALGIFYIRFYRGWDCKRNSACLKAPIAVSDHASHSYDIGAAESQQRSSSPSRVKEDVFGNKTPTAVAEASSSQCEELVKQRKHLEKSDVATVQ